MLYIGIDWSEGEQVVCICNAQGAPVSQFGCALTLAGFQRLDAERAKLNVPPSDCLVAIETTYHLMVDYLLDRSYPVYWVPPQATAAYRNRQRSSGAHTDQSDAWLLADIVRTDRSSHVRIRPNAALTQQLHALVRLSETLRRTSHRQTSQLRAWLVRAYPQALELFGDLSTQTHLHFLSAWADAGGGPGAQSGRTARVRQGPALYAPEPGGGLLCPAARGAAAGQSGSGHGRAGTDPAAGHAALEPAAGALAGPSATAGLVRAASRCRYL